MDEIDEAELISAGQSGACSLELSMAGSVPCSPSCYASAAISSPIGLTPPGAAAEQCGRYRPPGSDRPGGAVPASLRFDGCEFDSPLVVEGAQLFELSLTGCPRLPGLLGNGVRLRRDLDLSRSHVAGAYWTSASTSKRAAIWLCESEIGGRLLFVDCTIDGQGGRSIRADRVHVGGAVRLIHQFRSVGEVRLIGARIDGSLDLTGAREGHSERHSAQCRPAFGRRRGDAGAAR